MTLIDKPLQICPLDFLDFFSPSSSRHERTQSCHLVHLWSTWYILFICFLFFFFWNKTVLLSSLPPPSKSLPSLPFFTSFGCLVFSPFLSKCVRPGKLPSLFVPQFRWQIDFDSVNTDRLSDTDTTPDSTGVAPLPSQFSL